MSQAFFKNLWGRGTFSWPPQLPRRTITVAVLSTLGVAGFGWLVFSQEPFASRLEPLTSRMKKLMKGSRIPTDHDEGIQVDRPAVPSHPKSAGGRKV